ncbi:hypothetical protein [Rhizobium sp. FKY42]|uniref:hypothetical protein n=1 Tax=Rhizobium sp. FKY42 TaxID=2562310 RepID=UPI0010BFD496|nr:hypothetical protein [Rhizobium sp. FKY42]
MKRAILQAVDGCAHHFRVTLHGHPVEFCSDEADTGEILQFLFHLQAQVVERTKEEQSSSSSPWRIAVIRSDAIWNHEADRRPIDPEGEMVGLRTYWRPDFPSEFVVLSKALTVVRHKAPFRGLTVLLNEERLFVYVRPEADDTFIPHVETLAGYLWRRALWHEGFLDLHSAMLRYRGRGAVIIGPKMAGKTSLAMHFLARGAELLGSDFGEITMTPQGTLQAKAVPHICRITPETIADNAFLYKALDTTRRDGFAYRNGPVFSHGKYEFFAPGLDLLFNRPVNITSMNVDLLIFPKFSPDTIRQRITSIDSETARARLVQSIAHDRPLADWLPFPDVLNRQDREAPRLEALGKAQLRAVQVEFGREPSLAWEDITALFDTGAG